MGKRSPIVSQSKQNASRDLLGIWTMTFALRALAASGGWFIVLREALHGSPAIVLQLYGAQRQDKSKKLKPVVRYVDRVP
ncbi:unnamed protein product, partial [Iphiclides podalirius]